MTSLKPELRKAIYGLVAAVVPLLVIIGSISGDVAQQVLTVAAAILAVGGSSLAYANTAKPGQNHVAQIIDAVEAIEEAIKPKKGSAGTGKVASSTAKKPAAKKTTSTKKPAADKK